MRSFGCSSERQQERRSSPYHHDGNYYPESSEHFRGQDIRYNEELHRVRNDYHQNNLARGGNGPANDGTGDNSRSQHNPHTVQDAVDSCPGNNQEHAQATSGSKAAEKVLTVEEWKQMTDREKMMDLVRLLLSLCGTPSRRTNRLTLNCVCLFFFSKLSMKHRNSMPIFDLLPEAKTQAAVNFLIAEIEHKKEEDNSAQSKLAHAPSDDEDDEPDPDNDFAGIVLPEERKEPDVHHWFISALPHCVPLVLGFHVKEKEWHWCYCPCGYHMRTWRKRFKLEGIFDHHSKDECSLNTASDKKKKPDALRNHINQKTKEGGQFHWIVSRYLEILYPCEGTGKYERAEKPTQHKGH